MRNASLLLFIFAGNICFAGGEYSRGKIEHIEYKDSAWKFVFKQTTENKLMISNCDVLTVELEYQRVPWYSFLPFVESGHPSKKQTKNALVYLEHSFREGKYINFGYIGSGLKGTETKCLFKSKGLKLGSDQEGDYVVSFHSET
jgi:hypothetical protein